MRRRRGPRRLRERVGAWGRRPCAGSAGRGESVGSPAPAEAAENAELGVAVAEREGRGAEAARGAGPRSEAVFWLFVWKKMAHKPRKFDR